MQKKWLISIGVCLFLFLVTGFGSGEDKPRTCTLNVNVIGSGKAVGKGVSCSGICNVRLPEGTVVDLVAVPMAGWSFVGWGGACKGKEDCKVNLDSDKSVEVIFTYP